MLLTYPERAALKELGLRPAVVLRDPTGAAIAADVVQVRTDAWNRAAQFTNAGRTGVMPSALGPLAIALMEEAIPEAAGGLRLIEEHRALWRAGDASLGIPGLGRAAIEGCFAVAIERDTRLLEGLQSLDRRLHG